MTTQNKSNPIIKFLNKENRINLSIYFIFTTCLLIVSAIVLITLYVNTHIKGIAQEYNINLKTFNYSLSTLISSTFDENYKRSEIAKSTSLTKTLINRSILSYAYAINKKTRKVFWSSIPTIMGKNDIEAQSEVNFEHQDDKIEEVVNNYGDYVLILGLPQEKISASHLDILMENIRHIAALFLLIGLIASFIMAKIVLRPISGLTQGVQQFARGNFNHRLKNSNFSEINQLIVAYNNMAQQLNDLYTSLEQKVQERTVALERANQEIKETQAMMVHSEKMRSLGELVAGIAHEINNPINFIHGNIKILEKYIKDIYTLFDAYIASEENLDE